MQLLFFGPPGLSLLVSALFRWQCNISIRLPPKVCHWWCPPFSAGNAAFYSFVSLVVSALFRWPCSISIHLSPRSVTAGVRPPFSAGHVALLFFCLPGLSLVSIGHEAFLFICLPGPSLLVPCSISIHLSFRSVSGGVRPCPLAMKHVYSSVSQVRYCWCPPCWPGSISIHLSPRCVTAGVRPLPQHFYSFVSQVCHWCVHPFPSAMHQSPRSVTVWCPPFSAGDATFLFICFLGLSLLVSTLFRWPCSFLHWCCRPFPLAM